MMHMPITSIMGIHSILNIDSHYDLIGSDVELASAFSNLITNAIKYTPKGGTVTIGWHDDGNQGVILLWKIQASGLIRNTYHA